MADERVRVTLPKRLRPVLDRLTEPMGMGHTEFVTWLIDSYNARDLSFLPLITGEQQTPPKQTEQTETTKAAAISQPLTSVVPVQTDSAEDEEIEIEM